MSQCSRTDLAFDMLEAGPHIDENEVSLEDFKRTVARVID